MRSLLPFVSLVLLLWGGVGGALCSCRRAAGSIAIAATDSRIVEWANGATIDRGLADIADPSLGYATYGGVSGSGSSANTAPIGEPPQPQSTYYAVALGQGGTATLTFAQPIATGRATTSPYSATAFRMEARNGANLPSSRSVPMAYTSFAFPRCRSRKLRLRSAAMARSIRRISAIWLGKIQPAMVLRSTSRNWPAFRRC